MTSWRRGRWMWRWSALEPACAGDATPRAFTHGEVSWK